MSQARSLVLSLSCSPLSLLPLPRSLADSPTRLPRSLADSPTRPLAQKILVPTLQGRGRVHAPAVPPCLSWPRS